ncbi:RNA polymerase sigma factor [Flagellimonas algicola]|uniref:Sigma-70 family RNA polymerase sigma factor n=1 Tax=Flagellimonas algicola TaxID=2583815 RepID=A0ABY2WM76_9FLAO|nr:sigma-70 family RNA polymerase sigma factor [Allomuricauda algicola]TMU56104.1 sigma-70 family RNA polymerase sigma factor [Allomuricauda algicola]
MGIGLSMDQGNLWSKFKAGDKSAFESVYNLCIDDMYAYGLKLDTDRELVKDCIQEVFIDIYEHRNAIAEPQNIKFYILKALKHSIFKKRKKERKKTKFHEQPGLSFSAGQNFEDRRILSELDAEKKRLVNEALETLSTKQKEIMYLRFSVGLSYDEISEIVKIDHASVRKQVYRAVKKLRNSKAFDDYKGIVLFYSMLRVF